MEIYDVSVPLSADTPTYPGDPEIRIEDWLSFAKGDHANVSFMHLGLHSGTHVDAPAHFIPGGATVDTLPLSSLIGEAEVVAVPTDMRVIDADFVNTHCPRGAKRILFKTRNSAFWDNPQDGFRTDFTYLDSAAARLLVESGVEVGWYRLFIGREISVNGFRYSH